MARVEAPGSDAVEEISTCSGSFEIAKPEPSSLCRTGPAPPPAADAASCAPPVPGGAKLKALFWCVFAGSAVYLMMPQEFASDPMKRKSWNLFSIFVATILGIILQPLPMGAVAVMGLGTCMVTQTLTFPQAFNSMATEVPWLILFAFFFSSGFIKTGLGSRIGYVFVAQFGSTTLGLAYSLVAAELLLAPAIPSVCARAGGIFMPLAKSISEASGSRVGDGTEKKMGSFLFQCCFQGTCISSSMFLTAAASNPVALRIAQEIIGGPISWGQWALGACVPGLVNVAVAPAVLYYLNNPEIKRSPKAPETARAMLAEKGPMSRDETIMGMCLVFTVLCWIVGPSVGINAVAAAIMGLSILFVTGVITWKECLGNSVAWDTLIWFAALIAMASNLEKFGLVAWFSAHVRTFMGMLALSWQASLLLLLLVYFYSHYFFASGVAHILAMYGALASVAVQLGAPRMVTVLFFTYCSNLMGGLTHFGCGCAPSFYAVGYVTIREWWGYALPLSMISLSIWFTVGGAWWWVLGYWSHDVMSPITQEAIQFVQHNATVLQQNVTALIV